MKWLCWYSTRWWTNCPIYTRSVNISDGKIKNKKNMIKQFYTYDNNTKIIKYHLCQWVSLNYPCLLIFRFMILFWPTKSKGLHALMFKLCRCVIWWHSMMSYSHGIKDETTDEVCQEKCFLWERRASLGADFLTFQDLLHAQENIQYIQV